MHISPDSTDGIASETADETIRSIADFLYLLATLEDIKKEVVIGFRKKEDELEEIDKRGVWDNRIRLVKKRSPWDNRIRLAKKGWDSRIRLAKKWDNRIRLAKKWDNRIRLAKRYMDWDKRIRLAKKSNWDNRIRLVKKDSLGIFIPSQKCTF